MNIKTQDLIGPALDWALAKCEGHRIQARRWGRNIEWVSLDLTNVRDDDYTTWCPSYDWAQGGPIIERENISVICAEGAYDAKRRRYAVYWAAEKGVKQDGIVYGSQGDDYGQHFTIACDSVTGSTPLIAAMRCYVASKLGDEVKVPDEVAA